MQKALFVSLIWMAFLGAFGAARLQADNATISMSGPTTFKQTDGAALFQAICQGCHMPDARGAVGAGSYPSLAHNERLAAAGYPVTREKAFKVAAAPFQLWTPDVYEGAPAPVTALMSKVSRSAYLYASSCGRMVTR